jgi:ABC-type multidrug transport system fused ATPase/permease subunit
MHFIPTTPDSWFNLPRKNGVAYAAQESWVQNATIRDNILFGSDFDAVRYRKVIKQCALEKDLELFEAGDQTEVGEKGLTLSGGQKARVTLARAIYSPAEMLLLDDILAALDVHTSAWIVEKCFRGDLVKGRTILLVVCKPYNCICMLAKISSYVILQTHNIALVSPAAKFIVSIDQDGRVTSRGQDIEESLKEDPELAAEAERDSEALAIAQEEVPELVHKPPPTDGKLIIAEEIETGHVTWKSLKLFLSALGGNYPLIFYSLWVVGFLLTDWSQSFQTWFLGYWGSQYEKHPASEVKESFYLTAYSLILLTLTVVYTAAYIFFIYGSMRASRHINKLLVNSVLWSTLRWLDETPTARIITRCTQDMRSVDGWIPQGFSEVVEITMSIISKLGIIIIFSPPFLVPGVAVAALGLYLGNLYLKAQLSVKREMRYATAIMFTKYLSDPRKQCEIASVGSLQRGDIWNSLRSGIRC